MCGLEGWYVAGDEEEEGCAVEDDARAKREGCPGLGVLSVASIGFQSEW